MDYFTEIYLLLDGTLSLLMFVMFLIVGSRVFDPPTIFRSGYQIPICQNICRAMLTVNQCKIKPCQPGNFTGDRASGIDENSVYRLTAFHFFA